MDSKSCTWSRLCIGIHTEQTAGIWTRTPPTECGSGCGTAMGTGPVKFHGEKSKNM